MSYLEAKRQLTFTEEADIMTDITTPDDIQLLINTFYDKVKQDEAIGPIFRQIIGDDWSHHLPVMYSFWQMVLLDKHDYTGNPVQKHIAIDKTIRLQTEHYTRWLQLWMQTVNNLFTGEVADNAKKRAEAMMGLIRMKVEASRDGKSLI